MTIVHNCNLAQGLAESHMKLLRLTMKSDRLIVLTLCAATSDRNRASLQLAAGRDSTDDPIDTTAKFCRGLRNRRQYHRHVVTTRVPERKANFVQADVRCG